MRPTAQAAPSMRRPLPGLAGYLVLDLPGRQHHDPAVRLDADALRPDARALGQCHVDHPPLDGRHRLELDDLAGLDDALGGPVGDVAQLLLSAATVVLDIDRDPMMLPLAAADDEVHDVLQAGELLATAPDQRAEVVATHVEPGGVASARDLDGAGQVHQAQHLLEYRLG